MDWILRYIKTYLYLPFLPYTLKLQRLLLNIPKGGMHIFSSSSVLLHKLSFVGHTLGISCGISILVLASYMHVDLS